MMRYRFLLVVVEDLNIAKELLKQSHEEVAFRRVVIGYIAGVLRSDVAASIKVFIIIVLSLFVLISFEFAFLVVHVICAKLHLVQTLNFTPYLISFLVFCCGIVGPGIPLIMRMSSAEQSARLEAQFHEVEKRKKFRSKGERVGPAV